MGGGAGRRQRILGAALLVLLGATAAGGCATPATSPPVQTPVPRTASASKQDPAGSASAPHSATVRTDAGPTSVASGSPIRLNIPAIGVDAAVQAVGVLASGHLGVPSNWTDVAWYRDGPVPGQPGDAVIDGHLDSYTAPAVFWKLSSLRAGDTIEVQLSTGASVDFRVNTLRYVPYQSHDLGGIFSTTGPPSLTLITCGGRWLAAQRVYAERLVVHAELLSSGSTKSAAG